LADPLVVSPWISPLVVSPRISPLVVSPWISPLVVSLSNHEQNRPSFDRLRIGETIALDDESKKLR
jgi:hypothetical protein